MQAVAISHRNVHNRFAVDAIQYQQTAAAQEALDIKKVRTQVKDCIMLAQAEVMHRAAVGKGNGFAIAQTFLVKTVEVQFGSLAGKKDAEVEHLAGVAIKLGMAAIGLASLSLPLNVHCPRVSRVAGSSSQGNPCSPKASRRSPNG